MVALVAILAPIAMPSSPASASFASNKDAYGFTIADYYQPVYMSDFQGFKEDYYVTGSSKADYNIEIRQVFLKDTRDSTKYAFTYRVVTTPYNSRESYGFLNLLTRGGWWLNWQHLVKSQLRAGHDLTDWEPKNLPNTSSGSIGFAIGNGWEIGASLDWNHSELSLYSRTQYGANYYESEYRYDRGFWDRQLGMASTYMKYSVVSYGMFKFTTTGVAWVDISYTCGFEELGTPGGLGGVVIPNSYKTFTYTY